MKMCVNSLVPVVLFFTCLGSNEYRYALQKKTVFVNYTMMEDSIKTRYKEIAQKEADVLLSRLHGKLSTEFSKPGKSQVYLLEDGRYIVMGKKACYLYSSRQAILDTLNAGIKSEHILYGQNPYNQDFASHTKNLVEQMITYFHLERDKIDYTEGSLYYIDEKLAEAYESNRITYSDLRKYVINLIAYTGEVFIRKNDAQWDMVLADDKQTWQPYILTNTQVRIDMFVWIYDSVVNFQTSEMPSVSVGYYAKTNKIFKR